MSQGANQCGCAINHDAPLHFSALSFLGCTAGNDVDGFSDERSFRSRPALDGGAAADEQEVRFIGYGDQDWDEPGSVQTAALALRDVVSGGYDHFLLHFGDLSYGEGDVSDWDHWATQVEPYASRVP